tara:strand:- start:1195 stop:1770 length:576 start_codon:yes stop_codon:yes gene_type:complete
MKPIFNKEDFNSGDGMMTHVWGPSLWLSIHTMSFNYPVKPTAQDKKHYMNFIYSLEHVLPCRYCRENYKKNLVDTKFGLDKMKNRATFSKYVYNLHNHINKMLGKKIKIPFSEVQATYENFRARCTVDTVKSKGKKKKISKKSIKKSGSKKEKGCTQPLYGVKSKCVINIVERNKKVKTMNIDPKCKAKRK